MDHVIGESPVSVLSGVSLPVSSLKDGNLIVPGADCGEASWREVGRSQYLSFPFFQTSTSICNCDWYPIG